VESSAAQFGTGRLAYATLWSDYQDFSGINKTMHFVKVKNFTAEIKQCKPLFPVSNCMAILEVKSDATFLNNEKLSQEK
jgi:hypothetical protein